MALVKNPQWLERGELSLGRGDLSVVPEAERWHRLMEEQAQAREKEELSRKEAAAAKEAELSCWRSTARFLEEEKDAADLQAKDAELEAMRTVNEVRWQTVQRTTELEDRVKMLEALLEEERREHARKLQEHVDVVRHVESQAAERVQEADRRCDSMVAAAEARARVAKEVADGAQRRLEQEVSAMRIREEALVKRTRQQLEAMTRKCEQEKRLAIEDTHARVMQRQRAMEETLYANGRQHSEVLSHVREHGDALQLGMLELNSAEDVDAVMKQVQTGGGGGRKSPGGLSARLSQAGSAAGGSRDELQDLELSLHRRTMEQARERAARYSARSDLDTSGGRRFEDSLAGQPTWPPQTGWRATAGLGGVQTPRSTGSAFARAGGAVLA